MLSKKLDLFLVRNISSNIISFFAVRFDSFGRMICQSFLFVNCENWKLFTMVIAYDFNILLLVSRVTLLPSVLKPYYFTTYLL